MDIDNTLIRLREKAVDARLATLDGAILASIAKARADDLGRPLAFAGVFALIVGVAGAGLPTAPASAQPSLAPFGAASPLAPSTLLGDAP